MQQSRLSDFFKTHKDGEVRSECARHVYDAQNDILSALSSQLFCRMDSSAHFYLFLIFFDANQHAYAPHHSCPRSSAARKTAPPRRCGHIASIIPTTQLMARAHVRRRPWTPAIS